METCRICLSIDLLLVALIISTGFSESRVARRLQQEHFGLRIEIPQQIWRFRALLVSKSMKFGPWEPRNYSKIDAKGTLEAELAPRSIKSGDFLRISWFFEL